MITPNSFSRPSAGEPAGGQPQPGAIEPQLLALGVLGIIAIAAAMVVAPLLASGALIGLSAGLALARFLWNRSELSLLALVFITASFISANAINIPLPIGGIDLRDMGFVGVVGLVGIQQILRYGWRLTIPWWPVSLSILIFLGVALFSLIYALFIQRVQVNLALNEFRALLFLSVFFVTALTITDRRRLRTVALGLFLLADITALIVILQQFLGRDSYLIGAMAEGWRVEAADGASGSGIGSLRIIPPGHVLMFIAMLVSFAFGIRRDQSIAQRGFFGFQFLFINIGLLLTYTRSQWIAAALAIAIITLLIPAADRRALMGGVAVLLALSVVAFALMPAELRNDLLGSTFVEATVARFSTMLTPRETLQTYSLQWRIYENGEAFRSIREHPLIGIGLGNTYRTYTLTQKETMGFDPLFLRYIHNGYLYIAIKMGLIGLAAYAWIAFCFLFHGFRGFTRIRDPELKQLSLVMLAGFVGFSWWCITEPHLLYIEGMSTLGLMIGLVACALRLDMQSGEVRSRSQPASPSAYDSP